MDFMSGAERRRWKDRQVVNILFGLKPQTLGVQWALCTHKLGEHWRAASSYLTYHAATCAAASLD